jgi:probable O-glycosylation ligase (exosortase A-associated)
VSVVINTRKSQALLALSLCLIIAIAWKLVPHPVISIAIGLAPMAILFTLRQPFLMVLLFVVFSFFRIHEVFPQIYNFKIPLLLSLASLAALVWHVGISREIKVYWRPELTAMTAFFTLVAIGVIFASNRSVAMGYFNGIYWKIIVMTFSIAWLTRSDKDFTLASRLITFSGLLVGIVALYNKVNGIGLVEGTRVTIARDIQSVLGDPNDLALVLMFPMAFAVSLVMTKGLGRSEKILGLISTITLFSAVIATQSRGGLLGIMIVFGIFGYRRIKSKALFMSIGIIAAGLLFVLAGISDRASGGAEEIGVDASAMGRLHAWEAAIGMALHNPLTGVGINNFYSNYFFYSPSWDGINHAVHSTWFGVLAETGFLGLIVFVFTIGLLIKSAYNSLCRIEQQDKVNPAIHATAQAVLAGLLGTAVSGTFLTQGFTWPIYILAALVVSVAHWVDTNLPEVKKHNSAPGPITIRPQLPKN